MKIKNIYPLAILAATFTLCATPVMAIPDKPDTNNSEKNIAYSDPQKPILVKKPQPLFSITLQSNPTTGFLWSLKGFDANTIKPISRTYYPPQKNGLIGRGGYEKWLFSVKPAGFVVPQTTTITLIYARYSELEGAQVSNFKVVTTNDN